MKAAAILSLACLFGAALAANTPAEVKARAVSLGIVGADKLAATTADQVSTTIDITINSAAGGWTICGENYTETAYTEVIDPTTDPIVSTWHVRAESQPEISFTLPDSSKYFLMMIDETFGYVHGMYPNLGGTAGTKVTITKDTPAFGANGGMQYLGSGNFNPSYNHYVFALYKQTDTADVAATANETWSDPFAENARCTSITSLCADVPAAYKFDLSTFLTTHKLDVGGPIALSWWRQGNVYPNWDYYVPFIYFVPFGQPAFFTAASFPGFEAGCANTTFQYIAQKEKVLTSDGVTLESSFLDTVLDVKVSSPAGTYTACGKEYNEGDLSFDLSPSAKRGAMGWCSNTALKAGSSCNPADHVGVSTWQMRTMPVFSFSNVNPLNAMPDTSKYTLMMVDRSYGYVHGLWCNIPATQKEVGPSDTDKTGNTKNTNSGILTVLPYLNPANYQDTYNTYAFVLYKQNGTDVTISAAELASWGLSGSKPRMTTKAGGTFDVTTFMANHHLSKASGLSYVYSKMDSSTQWFYTSVMTPEEAKAAGDPLPCPAKKRKKKKKTKNVGAIVGGIIGALALCGLIGMMMMRRSAGGAGPADGDVEMGTKGDDDPRAPATSIGDDL